MLSLARVLFVFALAIPLAGQATFTIQMPIRQGDLGANAMGLNSFGAHIGNHGIDGHPGWDVEYRIGASAYAAADGVVQSVSVDPQSGRSTVQIQHNLRFRTDYTNLAEVDAAISPGRTVKAGQRLGLPGTNTGTVGRTQLTWASIHFQLDDFSVNYGLSNGFAVSPEPHLAAAGRALFDQIWSNAAYIQEICEPFPSNPRGAAFPLTRTWTRQSGALAARIDFTCAGALSNSYRYTLFDGAGNSLEKGNFQPQAVGSTYTFELQPDGGGTRSGALRIVSDTMQINFGAAGAASADLSGASVFRTAGYPLAVTSGASYIAGKMAPESIAAAFGEALAVDTVMASSLPLPTTLAGTRAMVEDSAGVARDAPLFYVSPSQIGFLAPPESANGAATVRVTSADGPVFTVAATIVRVAPGLFAADASGKGPAAAMVQRVRANGSQSVEPVAAGIDLGPQGEQVYLILYGTGLRLRNTLSDVTVRIAELELPAAYAGAQPAYPGLDQVNVLLPRSLAGQGLAAVSVMVAGVTSNTVTVSFR